MKTPNKILKYQQKCFETYAQEIGLPKHYSYIDGNPIRPLVPVEIARESLMIVGAYPSARFESREYKGKRYLIPVADNLSPFQPELYFDGVRTRHQESAKGLQDYYLRYLGITRDKCWITDLVKVFLFKEEHIKNYTFIGKKPLFPSTRKSFNMYAKLSIKFLEDEINLAQPVLVLSLGEEVARILSNNRKGSSNDLLTGIPYKSYIGIVPCYIAHVAHPDACRRSDDWRNKTEEQMKSIRTFLKEKGIVTG